MREIKFRYLINGKWHYFNLNEIEGAVACSEIMGQHYDARNQFIGRHDKNGKEIYEGDVVSIIFNFQKINTDICWNNALACWDFDSNSSYEDIFSNELYRLGSPTDDIDMEVIGNIHENPELVNADGR